MKCYEILSGFDYNSRNETGDLKLNCKRKRRSGSAIKNPEERKKKMMMMMMSRKRKEMGR